MIAVAAIVFAIVATANAGGYRFGVSDQAYYEPAIARIADATLFPRDAALLDVQSRFLGSVHLLGGLSRVTGEGLPSIFFWAYTLTMFGLFAASLTLARRMGLSWWAAAGLLVLLTLRHRIAKTGANSLEGYMHPRMLAFVFGVAACAAIARARLLAASILTVVAGLMHPTTGVWFAIVVATAFFVLRPAWRRAALVASAIAALVAIWALALGPFAGRLVMMDTDWLSVLAEKDYVFPSEWPAYAWLLNLAYPVVIALIYRERRRTGKAVEGEAALVAGVGVLVAVFLISVPLSAAHLAIAVQMQVNRIFWVADFLAMAYVAWWLVDRIAGTRWRAALVALLAAIAVGRGIYVLRVEADRRLVQATLPDTTWIEALGWIEQQPSRWFVLADPGHAWKYGMSARVGAHRDTLVEFGKDSSMAMYDRDVAMRVKERTAALVGFETMDATALRALAARYHLDVLVDRTRPLDLPALHRNADFTVYDLR